MTHSELSIAAAEQARRADSRIGALLVAEGKLSADNAERVLRLQGEMGIRYGEAERRLGLVEEADIGQVLARQFDFPYLRPGEGSCSPHLAAACDPFGPQAETLRAVRSQLLLRWFARAILSLRAQVGHKTTNVRHHGVDRPVFSIGTAIALMRYVTRRGFASS